MGNTRHDARFGFHWETPRIQIAHVSAASASNWPNNSRRLLTVVCTDWFCKAFAGAVRYLAVKLEPLTEHRQRGFRASV